MKFSQLIPNTYYTINYNQYYFIGKFIFPLIVRNFGCSAAFALGPRVPLNKYNLLGWGFGISIKNTNISFLEKQQYQGFFIFEHEIVNKI